MKFKYALGTTVKDKYTEFCGTIIARTEYISGENRYAIVTPHLKDGMIIGDTWLDESRIEEYEAIEKNKIGLTLEK